MLQSLSGSRIRYSHSIKLIQVLLCHCSEIDFVSTILFRSLCKIIMTPLFYIFKQLEIIFLLFCIVCVLFLWEISSNSVFTVVIFLKTFCCIIYTETRIGFISTWEIYLEEQDILEYCLFLRTLTQLFLLYYLR